MSESFSSKGTSSKNEKSVMSPGPLVKAVLQDIIVSDKGDMDWIFKNDTGGLNHKEFAIDKNHPKYNEKYAEYEISRIKHLALAYLGDEGEAKVDTIVAADFKGWASQVALMVKAAGIAEEVTLKVIVNPKNYVSFPLYPNFISSSKRKLEWSTNKPPYDNFTFSEKKPDAAPKDTAASGGSDDFKQGTDEDEVEF